MPSRVFRWSGLLFLLWAPVLAAAEEIPSPPPPAPPALSQNAPLAAAARFREGVDLWLAGRRDEALAAWKEATRLDPTLAEAHYNLAVGLRDRRIVEQRRNCLLEDDPMVCLTSVDHLAKDPPLNLEQSLRALDESVRLNPKHPRAWRLKGIVEGQLKRYREAADSLKRHLKEHPEDADSHYLLCAALRAGGRIREAVTACREAVLHRPDFAEAHHLLGSLYLDLRQAAKARESFEQVIGLRPDSPAAWFNLGLAQDRLEAHQKAVDAYLRALDLGGAPGPAHLNLGAAYHRLGRFSRAIDHTRQAREAFARARDWRQVRRAQNNLDRFHQAYWGLPRDPELF